MSNKPDIPDHLLWEYDLATFDYKKSYKVVIERICERGTLSDWREMVAFYAKSEILETLDWSEQLSKKDKDFTVMFLDSGFLRNAS